MDTNKTVLVGISGGIHSTIAAYMLKRQGHNVIGAGLLFSNAGEVPTNRRGEELKSFFQSLQIPYHEIEECEKYQARIIDPMVSARIGGYLFCARSALNNLILEALASHRPRFKADTIATGHRARLIHNHRTHAPEIHCAKGYAEGDQSHLLAFSPPEPLARLELPLTGISPVDMEKIAGILNLDASPTPSFLPHTLEHPASLLEKKIPPGLREKGDIIHHTSQCVVGGHKGIHHFSPGSPLPSGAVTLRDKGLKKKCAIPVQIIWQRRQVVIMEKSKWIPCTHIILSHCRPSPPNGSQFPFVGALKIGTDAPTTTAVRIRPLNNHNILCQLAKPWFPPLFPGESAVLYDGDKAILGGNVFQAGHLRSAPGVGPRLRLLPLTGEEENLLSPPTPSPADEDISRFIF